MKKWLMWELITIKFLHKTTKFLHLNKLLWVIKFLLFLHL